MYRPSLVTAFSLSLGVFGVSPEAFLSEHHPPPRSEPGRDDVALVASRRVFADGVPDGVVIQPASNNLDVVRHAGRVFLAFRTAPSHFASADAVLYVVSSDDELHWRREARFALGRDVREPRFLALGDRLLLYATTLGTSALSFEPGEVTVAERGASGAWSEPSPVGLTGHVAWRLRKVGDVPVMIAYAGGEHLYRFDGVPMQVKLLTTEDGRRWTPLDPAHPVLYEGGGSEADFVATADGFVGVIRDEAGDATGWGTKICHASAGALAEWSCRTDARKMDSPLFFAHDGDAYLVARRNVTATGAYDLGLDVAPALRTIHNQLAYIWNGKRCALWRWVAAEERMAFVLDLPSRGDTCFASAIAGERPDEWIVYDYSSDVDGPDYVWNEAQRGTTHLYRHVLRFAPRGR